MRAPATSINGPPAALGNQGGRVRIQGPARLAAPRPIGILHGDEGDRREDTREGHARAFRGRFRDLEDLLEEPRDGVGVGNGRPLAGRRLRGQALTEGAQRLLLQAELLGERLGEPRPGDRGGHVPHTGFLRLHLRFEYGALAIVRRVLVLETLREPIDEPGLDRGIEGSVLR